MRDDFPEDVKRAIASRVANRCSNPDCKAVTSGPQDDPAKAVNVGVAAHITAASAGGARYDPSLSTEARRHVGNGIWLCQNCGKLVDNDLLHYPVDVLRKWKADAEEAARSLVGKTARSASDPQAAATAGRLRVELPTPINPVGHRSAGGCVVLGWRFKVRLVAEGQPLDILELELFEEGVGAWTIEEVFREHNGRPVRFPIQVERATEFWISAVSPRASETKSTSVGRITLRFRDHTQPVGEAHEHVIEQPPMR